MPSYINEGGRAPLVPGGRANPDPSKRPICQIAVRELPRPRLVPAPYYVAMVVEVPTQQAHMQLDMPGGRPLMIGPPILSVISDCPVTATKHAFMEAAQWTWQPQPHPHSPMNIDQLLRSAPNPADRSVPLANMLDHVKIIQTGILTDDAIPPMLALRPRNSEQVFPPCGTAVGHSGAAIGDPCPTGPCALSGGGDCVWAKQRLNPQLLGEIISRTHQFRQLREQRQAAGAVGNPVAIPAPPGARQLAPPGAAPGASPPAPPAWTPAGGPPQPTQPAWGAQPSTQPPAAPPAWAPTAWGAPSAAPVAPTAWNGGGGQPPPFAPTPPVAPAPTPPVAPAAPAASGPELYPIIKAPPPQGFVGWVKYPDGRQLWMGPIPDAHPQATAPAPTAPAPTAPAPTSAPPAPPAELDPHLQWACETCKMPAGTPCQTASQQPSPPHAPRRNALATAQAVARSTGVQVTPPPG